MTDLSDSNRPGLHRPQDGGASLRGATTIELRLSPGERDVLLDVGVGLTDCAIASRHGMSRRGIQNRLASIYRKLGVHRSTRDPKELAIAPRSRAVFLALEHGLIEPGELSSRAREHGTAQPISR